MCLAFHMALPIFEDERPVRSVIEQALAEEGFSPVDRASGGGGSRDLLLCLGWLVRLHTSYHSPLQNPPAWDSVAARAAGSGGDYRGLVRRCSLSWPVCPECEGQELVALSAARVRCPRCGREW